MIIEEATKQDLRNLSNLAKKTYTETFGDSFTPEELETQLQDTRSKQYFLDALDRDVILVAKVDAQITGYIQISNVGIEVDGCEIDQNDQSINALYVGSEHQGNGIGKALMNAAFKHPRITKSKFVYIDVWEENKRAVNFYKNYGFTTIGKCNVLVDGKCVGEDLVLRIPTQK